VPLELSQRMAFSDEQGMLGDTASGFFADNVPMGAVRAQLETAHGFDAALWRQMVDLGWPALAVPEALGGGGLGVAEAVTIAEPMGRTLCAAPFLSTQLFVQALLHGGTEGQRMANLQRIVDGGIATVALFEDDGDWQLDRVQARASRSGARIRLRGSKALVTDAAAADVIAASVRYDDAPALVVLGRDDLPPDALRREAIVDETRRSYSMSLDDVEVPIEQLIHGPAALRALAAIERSAWLLLAAEATGGIAGALALTVDYLNTRTAFGRKIGSYQALKHPCVDILIGLERARSHVYHAASLLAYGEPAETALRMAKAQASDGFAFAGDRAVQFHGAIGFTFECNAQLFLRRALWVQYSFGDAPHHRRRLADSLFGPSGETS
jgi:acyl-CoA dehydrogenase